MAAASEVVAEDRQLLQHKPHLLVVIDELDDVGQRAAAIAAIVVEELDHAHIAVRVAGDVGEGRAENGIGVVADDLLLFRLLLGRLALVELARHLDQDLGVLGEIVADDIDDLLVLDSCTRKGQHARRHARQDRQGGDGHERGHDGGNERGQKA